MKAIKQPTEPPKKNHLQTIYFIIKIIEGLIFINLNLTELKHILMSIYNL